MGSKTVTGSKGVIDVKLLPNAEQLQEVVVEYGMLMRCLPNEAASLWVKSIIAGI